MLQCALYEIEFIYELWQSVEGGGDIRVSGPSSFHKRKLTT